MFDIQTYGCEVCSSVFQEDPCECGVCGRIFCAECLETAQRRSDDLLECGICNGSVVDAPSDPTASVAKK